MYFDYLFFLEYNLILKIKVFPNYWKFKIQNISTNKKIKN